MPSTLCETCAIVFQDGKKFCRVCGAALRRNSALPASAVLCSCPACTLQYLIERSECVLCGRLLARTLEQVADRDAGAVAAKKPPASPTLPSRATLHTYAEPLSAPPQRSLPVAELPVLFHAAGQQISQTESSPVIPRKNGLRSHATAIFAFLVFAGLGIAGVYWGIPLTQRFWTSPENHSTQPASETTSLRPNEVEGGPQVAAASSVHRSKAEAHNTRGVDLAQAGNIDGAIAEFRRAVAADPRNFKAHNNLGVLYKRKGWITQAINEYKAASRADPINPVPYKNMAILQEEQRRLAEALRNYARYLDLAPNASDAEVIRSKVIDLQSKTESKSAR